MQGGIRFIREFREVAMVRQKSRDGYIDVLTLNIINLMSILKLSLMTKEQDL